MKNKTDKITSATEVKRSKASDKTKCKKCGQILSNSDYGFYCSNKKCSLYNIDILAYDNTPDKIEIFSVNDLT